MIALCQFVSAIFCYLNYSSSHTASGRPSTVRAIRPRTAFKWHTLVYSSAPLGSSVNSQHYIPTWVSVAGMDIVLRIVRLLERMLYHKRLLDWFSAPLVWKWVISLLLYPCVLYLDSDPVLPYRIPVVASCTDLFIYWVAVVSLIRNCQGRCRGKG